MGLLAAIRWLESSAWAGGGVDSGDPAGLLGLATVGPASFVLGAALATRQRLNVDDVQQSDARLGVLVTLTVLGSLVSVMAQSASAAMVAFGTKVAAMAQRAAADGHRIARELTDRGRDVAGGVAGRARLVAEQARELRVPPAIRRRAPVGIALLLAFGAFANLLDWFGPPPAGDESEFGPQLVGEQAAVDDLEGAPSAFAGSLEGGDPGTLADENALVGNGRYDVPTGGRASPLFGARKFEQRMLRLEEFGRHDLDSAPVGTVPFPRPSVGPAPEQDPFDLAASGPSGAALDSWLIDDGLYYTPTEFSNEAATNPWQPDVEAFLGRPLDTPPVEGRPPGRGWAHQRWNEFFPEVYTKTVQAGARANGGVRDRMQLHDYSVGEFGPGGLYHTVYDTDLPGGPVFSGTTDAIPVRFHPSMPAQNHNSLWTFDGTFPMKLMMGRHGEPILLRHANGLPIDPSANYGFGLHTLTTHEHNGHNPAESDGFANAFFFPGQYWDYRWPMQLAGYDTVNTDASDPRAAFPCSPGETLWVNDLSPGLETCDADGRINIRGDWRELVSTHWFHDHMLDFTAQNVYKGNAAMFNYYSATRPRQRGAQRRCEPPVPEWRPRFSWGNRDYDVNLVFVRQGVGSTRASCGSTSSTPTGSSATRC